MRELEPYQMRPARAEGRSAPTLNKITHAALRMARATVAPLQVTPRHDSYSRMRRMHHGRGLWYGVRDWGNG